MDISPIQTQAKGNRHFGNKSNDTGRRITPSLK
jgi:hypothetical protein